MEVNAESTESSPGGPSGPLWVLTLAAISAACGGEQRPSGEVPSENQGNFRQQLGEDRRSFRWMPGVSSTRLPSSFSETGEMRTPDDPYA